jgi:hypothetical protein
MKLELEHGDLRRIVFVQTELSPVAKSDNRRMPATPLRQAVNFVHSMPPIELFICIPVIALFYPWITFLLVQLVQKLPMRDRKYKGFFINLSDTLNHRERFKKIIGIVIAH